MYRAGFDQPGHTEYLAQLATERTGNAVHPVMMLWAPELAVVPVTIHIPLIEVPHALSTGLIVKTGRIVAHDLAQRFGIARSRLAVAGLNPHAGEDGTLGTEDRDIVAPAVRLLKSEGIDARGPLPADTMFHAAARATYDVALCMYHDQALIPIKDTGVRPWRQRHARPAHRADFARPRYGVRHRRQRQGRSIEPDRRPQAGNADDHAHGTHSRRRDMSAADDLPPLRDVIRRHELSARKSLGRISCSTSTSPGALRAPLVRWKAKSPGLSRSGPGPGGLTRALLTNGARRVIAIERDARAVAALAEIAERYPGQLDIIEGDALDFGWRAHVAGPVRIVANLPYNIATALLIGWLTTDPWPPWYEMMVLMFQREVAERIVATAPVRKPMAGYRSSPNWRCETRILFDIAPSAFVAAAEGRLVGRPVYSAHNPVAM